MNKFLRVLLYIFSSITMVLALAFIVLEGRLVIAGDWVIYDNAADGFIRYFFRLLLAIIVFAKWQKSSSPSPTTKIISSIKLSSKAFNV